MADKELRSLNFKSGDVYFPLPIVSAEDNDKILMVVDGEWQAATYERASRGQYCWTASGMTETVTEATGVSYTLTTPNTTRPSSTIEYSASAPVYEDGTWKMVDSTVETLVNTDTYVPSATNVYVRLTDAPNVWYLVTSFTAGALNTSGTCTKSMAYSTSYTAAIGDVIDYVVSDDAAEYADGAWVDGYCYTSTTSGGATEFNV